MEDSDNGSMMDLEEDLIHSHDSEVLLSLPDLGIQALQAFPNWNRGQQRNFVQELMLKLDRRDLVAVQSYVSPVLTRDFISMLPGEIAEKILSYLDPQTLCKIELVSKTWYKILRSRDSVLWRRLLEANQRQDLRWDKLSGKVKLALGPPRAITWKRSYSSTEKLVDQLRLNWESGFCKKKELLTTSNGIYCLQFDDTKIVSGSRDHMIKIWSMQTLQLLRQYEGHTGSVLCLQFDDRKIISGSSDASVIVWDLHTGHRIATLNEHAQSVLHLKFNENRLVTCSKDRTVTVWKIEGDEYTVECHLRGHRAAVNVVEFDENHIVSASGDRTIRLWETSTGTLLHQFIGHERGIACLQYRGDYIVSGSSDAKLKVWHIPSRECIHTLTGHLGLVRCVRFDEKRIVSGSYDNTIRIWDFTTGECKAKLEGHTNRVFRLQFDDFKIVSSSQDDQIRIWDFSPDVVTPADPHRRRMITYNGIEDAPRSSVS